MKLKLILRMLLINIIFELKTTICIVTKEHKLGMFVELWPALWGCCKSSFWKAKAILTLLGKEMIVFLLKQMRIWNSNARNAQVLSVLYFSIVMVHMNNFINRCYEHKHMWVLNSFSGLQIIAIYFVYYVN